MGRRVAPGPELESTNRKLFAANGTSIPLLGKIIVKFRIRDIECSAAVVVSETVEDMILGIDWLRQNNCHLELGSGTLVLRGRRITLVSKGERIE